MKKSAAVHPAVVTAASVGCVRAYVNIAVTIPAVQKINIYLLITITFHPNLP